MQVVRRIGGLGDLTQPSTRVPHRQTRPVREEVTQACR
jgi:hypothetical protein